MNWKLEKLSKTDSQILFNYQKTLIKKWLNILEKTENWSHFWNIYLSKISLECLIWTQKLVQGVVHFHVEKKTNISGPESK